MSKHIVLASDVTNYAKFLKEKHNVRIIHKKHWWVARMVAFLACRFGWSAARRFANSYAQAYKTTMYLPFTPGRVTDKFPAFVQLQIMAHEFEHILIYRDEGHAYTRDYLKRKSARATYEARCYTVNLELSFWMYHKIPNQDERAASLKAYGCDSTDIKVAAKYLRACIPTVRHGGVIREATEITIAWLESR